MPGGVCSHGGVSALGGGGVCLGGVCSGGMCLLQGVAVVVVSQHALRQKPPPPTVNRMTNRCKNITLATTSLRPVNIFPFASRE